MPTRVKNRLTDKFCKTAPDGTHADGNGLNLRVGNGGRQRSWGLRVMVSGKARLLGLGSYPAVSLADARRAATAARTELKAGRPAERLPDPEPVAILAPVAVATAPTSDCPTFRECAERVIALRAPNWSSERHATQWTESLTLHVYPLIGDTPVGSITSGDVMDVLEPIWNCKAETATRVKQRMGVVFDFAIAYGHRPDNPAAAVGKALPRRPRQKQHHPAMAYADAPAFVSRLRESEVTETVALALEFLILTASRSAEVRGATLGEFDLDAAIWTVPATRMKMRHAHRVPLSNRAVEIVRWATRHTNGRPADLVFASRRTGRALSDMAFAMPLRRLETHAVPHGFRASFRSWAMECTATPWAVCERALAHKLGGSEVEAYARGDLLDQRRELMQAWADYIG